MKTKKIKQTEKKKFKIAIRVTIFIIDSNYFKIHKLPLARIKKIMKSDEDVRMISAETPALFAKACEMFIIELAQRSFYFT